jgi:hypothetical protein
LVKIPERCRWSSASVEKSLDAARNECVRHTLGDLGDLGDPGQSP